MKRAERSVEIAAPPRACFEALLRYETFPDWQAAVRSAEVLSRDEQGRGRRVAFGIDAKVRRVSYVLEYSYEEPHWIGWDYVEGDVEAVEGEYRLEVAGSGGTLATYVLGLDPGVWLPGRVLSLLRDQVMKGSVEDLKRHVEDRSG